MDKLRVAQFSDTFLPIVDGVGRVAYNYAKYISEHGHECYVICPQCDTGYRGGLPFEIVDFVGVRVPMTPQQYRAGIPTFDSNYVKRMDMLELDILHAHSPSVAGMESVRIAKKKKVPLIGTFHSKYYDDVYEITGSKMMATFGAQVVVDFYDHCDEVWTVSEDARKTLYSYGYDKPIRIVPNGTERVQVLPAGRQEVNSFLGIGDEPLLLYVGQIDYKKNLDRTLKACALLKKEGVNFKLAMVGQGKDMESLKKIAEELDIKEEVIFTGHVLDTSLLCGIYERAGLFVFPSLYDTAGLVVREAAVMGTPAVVIRDSAPAEVITDGQNGFTCLDTTGDLFAVLSRALDDQEKLCAVGKNARESIPVYWSDIFPEVIERYRELIELKKQEPKKKKRLSKKRRDEPVI